MRSDYWCFVLFAIGLMFAFLGTWFSHVGEFDGVFFAFCTGLSFMIPSFLMLAHLIHEHKVHLRYGDDLS